MNKQELLSTPCWDYKAIMFYCGVKKSKAFEIMKICKEQLNGAVRFNTHVVKRDSVLAYLDTDIEKECYVLKNIT